MKATVIIIGDEILLGRVTDTNSGHLARELNPYGWEVNSIITVGDDKNDIYEAISVALKDADVVLTSGGMGPTKDDITKGVLLKYFGGELIHDTSVSENIRHVFMSRGLKLNTPTANQALVPSSARVIQNPVGTAPILWFERGDKVLVAMPGVPSELEYVSSRIVIPELIDKFSPAELFLHKTFILSGISESSLSMKLDEWEQNLPLGFSLAYLPNSPLLTLRLDGRGHTYENTKQTFDQKCTELASLISDYLITSGEKSLTETLIDELRKRSFTLATAESCTGGNIAHQITLIPGASDIMVGGVVAYSNSVKESLLGVRHTTLAEYGAVSIPTVTEMAEGVKECTGADIGIATSGIAGPSGGSAEKPVGTVCVAVTLPHKGTVTQTLHLRGNRSQIIDRATVSALLLCFKNL